MHHFDYDNGRLHAEGVDLNAIAQAVGTPTYVYSQATLLRHFNVFREAFGDADPLVAFSVKANSNIAVVRALSDAGAGADVVSGGELFRALKAGVSPDGVIFSGVGKTRSEMDAALNAGIAQFNVESAEELAALDQAAQDAGKRAPVALRVNPDIAAGGHAKISTGKREDKFGVAWEQAPAIYRKAAEMAGIEVVGVDVHIGSQIADLTPFEAAFRKTAELITDLRADGISIKTLDLGGGLGIPYNSGEIPPSPNAYAKMIRKVTDPLDVRLIFEPGRMIAGNAGILLTSVVYVKEGADKKFLILDAGMNDLIRPALYDAWHDMAPVKEPSGAPTPYEVVGPVCETGDRFASARELPPLAPGDLVALMSAGAYGAVQASQYNSRPLIPEVLVNGPDFTIVRKRPSYDDMLALESFASWQGDEI